MARAGIHSCNAQLLLIDSDLTILNRTRGFLIETRTLFLDAVHVAADERLLLNAVSAEASTSSVVPTDAVSTSAPAVTSVAAAPSPPSVLPAAPAVLAVEPDVEMASVVETTEVSSVIPKGKKSKGKGKAKAKAVVGPSEPTPVPEVLKLRLKPILAIVDTGAAAHSISRSTRSSRKVATRPIVVDSEGSDGEAAPSVASVASGSTPGVVAEVGNSAPAVTESVLELPPIISWADETESALFGGASNRMEVEGSDVVSLGSESEEDSDYEAADSC